tara:strand:+ start:1134 stop:1472 length:339 start_codon:yes stop_codon:yes gene_type:complete
MGNDKFTFGNHSRMKEVPAGEHAELLFSGIMKEIETDWGQKWSYEIILLSHPSYESIPKDGIPTVWESKSQCAEQLWIAASTGEMKQLTKALEEEKWKLIRTHEGTYFLEQM